MNIRKIIDTMTLGCVIYGMLGAGPPEALGQSSFTPLGIPEGYDYNQVPAVSPDGGTVLLTASKFVGSEVESESFVWTAADGLQSLGFLSARRVTAAAGLSDHGEVVVGLALIPGADGDAAVNFRWTLAGGLEQITVVPTLFTIMVSGDGTVIAGSRGEETDCPERDGPNGTIYTIRNGSVQRLTGFADCTSAGHNTQGVVLNDISRDGSVLVGSAYTEFDDENGNTQVQAALWVNGSLQGLGVFGGGRTSSYAGSVTADGMTVYGYDEVNTDASTLYSLFVWNDGSRQQMPLWDGSISIDQPLETFTSGNGDLVYLPRHRRIWHAQSGWHTYESFFNDAGLDLSGWSSWGITDVSDDGTVFVGQGTNPDGKQEAFRMVVAPCTVVEQQWTGGEDGAFGEAGNWSGQSVPAPEEAVRFEDGSVNVFLGQPRTSDALTVRDASLSLQLDQAAYTLTAASGCLPSLSVVSLEAGVEASSGLTLYDGSVAAHGDVVIRGHGANIDVSDGATLIIDADNDQNGTLRLGADASVDNPAALFINGGRVESRYQTFIGHEAGTRGLLSISALNGEAVFDGGDEGELTVGYAGRGLMEVTDAGQAGVRKLLIASSDSGEVRLNSEAALYVDEELIVGAGSDGLLLAEGSGTTVSFFGRQLNIGVFGNGELYVKDGASVLGTGTLAFPTTDIVIGFVEDVTGKLTIEGAETQISGFTDLIVGEGGAGEVLFTDEADVAFDRIAVAREPGSGIVRVEEGGSLTVSDHVEIAMKRNTVGRVDIDGHGSVVSFFGNWFEVGVDGEGHLEISDGAELLGASSLVPGGSKLALGVLNGSSGNVKVDGTGSQVAGFTNVFVGDGGFGDLQVTNGASVEADTVWLGREVDVKGGQLAAGSVYIGGVGSELLTRALCVGCNGIGVLAAQEGGQVYTGTLAVGENGQLITPITYVTMVPPPGGNSSKSAAHTSSLMSAEGGIYTQSLIIAGGAQIESDSVYFGEGGILGGSAAWPLPIVNQGTIAPGDAEHTDVFTASAGYTQTAAGVLAIDLGPEGSDRLAVTGTAVLDGIVRFDLLQGYVPVVGSQYDIVTAGEVTGLFMGIETVPGLTMSLIYEANRVMAVVEDVTVSVEEVSSPSEIPATFALEQNYPNPFNPFTTVRFSVPAASKVTLILYDLLGREIRRMVDESLPPGIYKATIDAHDLVSGVYFCRLEARSSGKHFVQTRKLTLLK